MKRWYWLLFIVFAVIVLLPPVMHGDKLLVINNDTANHIAAFEAIKSGEPHFAYLGQRVTGYTLVWLEDITRIDLQVLFMWFNYLVVLLGGLAVAALVIIITKSWLGGILSAVIITLGIGSTQHLFWSGTTFNLQSYIILLPLWLIAVYRFVRSKNYWWVTGIIGLGTLMFFWHPSLGTGLEYLGQAPAQQAPSLTPLPTPSPMPTPYSETVISPALSIPLFFGLTNIVLLTLCAFIVNKNKIKIDNSIKIVIGIIGIGAITMLGLSTFYSTVFSSRMAINACLLLGLFLCIGMGTALNNSTKLAKASIIGLIIVGTVPNLINWFTWTSFYNPVRGAY
jgi:hypothetical protein